MNVGGPEIIILIIVVLLLFGSKKLPDAARSMGRSMRIFKSEVKEMGNDDKRFEEQQQQIEAQQTNQVNPAQNPVQTPEPVQTQQPETQQDRNAQS